MDERTVTYTVKRRVGAVGPKPKAIDMELVEALRGDKLTYEDIAQRLGVSRRTLFRRLKMNEETYETQRLYC